MLSFISFFSSLYLCLISLLSPLPLCLCPFISSLYIAVYLSMLFPFFLFSLSVSLYFPIPPFISLYSHVILSFLSLFIGHSILLLISFVSFPYLCSVLFLLPPSFCVYPVSFISSTLFFFFFSFCVGLSTCIPLYILPFYLFMLSL